jgi:hypothetical protein
MRHAYREVQLDAVVDRSHSNPDWLVNDQAAMLAMEEAFDPHNFGAPELYAANGSDCY